MEDWMLRYLAALAGATAAGLSLGWLLTRGLPRLLARPCPRCGGGRLLPAGLETLPPEPAPDDAPWLRLPQAERVYRCTRCGHTVRRRLVIADPGADPGALPPHLLADYLEAQVVGTEAPLYRRVVERLRRQAARDQEGGRGSQG